MQNNITYFTFNDLPNGVYNSQVIEVVDYLNSLDKDISVRLLTLISPRGFYKNKATIKKLNNKAIVLPAIAPLKFWNLNKLLIWLVSLFLFPSKIICRGPLATCLALSIFKNKASIVYDGRGAVVAEQNEYGVFDGTGLENKLLAIEKRAVIESHYRIAVTEKLVDYWREQFNYSSNKHVIIPCTVSEKKSITEVPQAIASFVKRQNNKVIFTFAGGNGKWQGIDLMLKFLTEQFEQNTDTSALLLCPINNELKAFQEKYNDRVCITSVQPSLVQACIKLCDYGLLLRHKTITNKVASPVKVAEYLQAGLKVIISPEIGDYTEVIVKEECGRAYSGEILNIVRKLNNEEKRYNQHVAKNLFSKNSIVVKNEYKKLLSI